MCLAIPMKIVEINDAGIGIADLDTTRHEVNLSLVDSPVVGDYVIVHAGFAIEKLDREEADERLALFEELAQAMAESDPE
jgi:hydrogenase expression/formation protein HypC